MSAKKAFDAIDDLFATVNPIYEAIDEGDLNLKKLEKKHDFTKLINALNAATKALDELAAAADFNAEEHMEEW